MAGEWEDNGRRIGSQTSKSRCGELVSEVAVMQPVDGVVDCRSVCAFKDTAASLR